MPDWALQEAHYNIIFLCFHYMHDICLLMSDKANSMHFYTDDVHKALTICAVNTQYLL